MQATNKTITQGNRLIAEFMNLEFLDMTFTQWMREGEISDAHKPCLDQFNYHESWDSLMPVIDKINNLGITTDDNGYKLIEDIEWSLTSCVLIDTYEAVVEFIEWYNQDCSEKEAQLC